MNENDLVARLTGRARYLRDQGQIKSPELLEEAARAMAARATLKQSESLAEPNSEIGEGRHGE
ncbi:hypothetical protein [Sphingobium sp.]|uniref:hypothetical protein n=1 Tax=Sphingobium sp. TaxID=1912891 RepID=UPI0026351142|nr:hypothetical protein [Sphingobium sp.]